MKAALVVMAAGLGSRYGGNKQVDGVGPNGEILMEYGIYDAVRAGFTKIVLIIKRDIVDLVDRLCGELLRSLKTPDGGPVEVSYVFQDYSNLPAFYTIPPERTKPFGTVHALLCTRESVHEPFCVINADDYYGADAYRQMYRALETMPPEGSAAMVGYLLKNTVSPYGTVSRGLCKVHGGVLQEVKETTGIRLMADGTIADTAAEVPAVLDGESVVSMNLWGFQPAIFGPMQAYLEEFLRSLPADERKAECLLPNMVGQMVDRGELSVQVLTSQSRWFGMTYQEDRPKVAAELMEFHRRGVYPPTLK